MKRVITYRSVTVHWDKVIQVLLVLVNLATIVGGSLLTDALRQRSRNTCRKFNKPDATFDDSSVAIVGGSVIAWVVFVIVLIQAQLRTLEPHLTDGQETLLAVYNAAPAVTGFMLSLLGMVYSVPTFPCFAAQGLAPLFIIGWTLPALILGLPVLRMAVYGLVLVSHGVVKFWNDPFLPDALRVVTDPCSLASLTKDNALCVHE